MILQTEPHDDADEILQVTIAEEQLGMHRTKPWPVFSDYSRTRLQGLIEVGECLVNNQIAKPHRAKWKWAMWSCCRCRHWVVKADPQPENIPLTPAI